MNRVLWSKLDGGKYLVIGEILDLDQTEVDVALEDLAEGYTSEIAAIRQGDHAAASRLITNMSGGEDQAFRVDDDATRRRPGSSAERDEDRRLGDSINGLNRLLLDGREISFIGKHRQPCRCHRCRGVARLAQRPSDQSDEKSGSAPPSGASCQR